MKNNIISSIITKFNSLHSFSKQKVSYLSILDKLISFFIFSGIFLFPLIFSVFLQTGNTFALYKLTFLKVYIIILFFLFVIREVSQISPIWSKFKKIFKKYYLFPTLFIVLFGVSILFSSDITTSFFGKIDRQQGYLSYILYFLWFVFLSLELIRNKSLKRKSNLNLYLFSFVLSGFIASLYGIMQYLGIDFYTWSEEPFITKRAFSSLGQPNFFASWLLLVLPLSVALGVKAKKYKTKIFLFFVSFINLLALFTTGSRAAWLALIFIFFLIFIKLIVIKKISVKGKIISIVFIILFTLSSLYLIEQQIPGRISQMFDIKKGSTSARVDFYSVAAEAISKKPIVGYGVENIQQTYVGYYDASWGVHSDVNQVPDRAHNLILDILMAGGIILFIAYTFLYFDFYRKYKYSLIGNNNRLVVNAFFLGVSAYLLSLLFGFSIPSGELYFFSYLAILTYFTFSSNFK
ncbi:MAG: oligosaccharide repeat unit polymerase, partial [Patescibacteria group bacterium]|nr:oligosaccharide repeat unit polymerase [Patescibacteria group bacterium]